jgi:hypothetical protein
VLDVYRVLVEDKKGDKQEDLDIGEKIVLKSILEK